MLTGHGDDRHIYKYPIRADFSSNVVPGGTSPALTVHLQNALHQIDHYPEPDAASLAILLADHHRLNAKNVLVANGSVEAFYLLAQFFQKRESQIYCPSFAEYEDACRIFMHEMQFVPVDEFGLHPISPYSLVWLGNPNNPDGKITSSEKIEGWLKNNPESFLIADEAYAELCSGFQSAISLLKSYPNLIIVRSFTKTFAIPALRLGYVLASGKIIQELTQLKMPWSVNQLAIEAGKYILKNYNLLKPDMADICINSQQLQAAINRLPGLKVIPSATNYFLLETEKGTGADLKNFLLEKHGILVRDAGNFRFATKNCVRIAVQEEAENQLLIDAIKQWTTNC